MPERRKDPSTPDRPKDPDATPNPAADPLAAALGFDPAAEGLDLAPGEADGLLAAAQALTRGSDLAAAALPEPDPAELERLAAALAPFLPSPVARQLAADPDAAGTGGLPGWPAAALAAVRPQVRILRRPFWLASAAVVAAGLPLLDPGLRALMGLNLGYGGFLVLVAPVLAALGVAYAFRSAGTGMAEIEMTCALTPAQLVLGRLFWVAAYDAGLLAVASLAAAGLEPGVRLGWLVLGWLAPMLLLAGAALALSFYVPPWLGAGAALALWGGALLAGLSRPHLFLPALAGTPAALPLIAAAGGGALCLTGALAALAPRLALRLAGLATGEGM